MICAASGLDLADCDKLLRVVALRACFIMPATLEHAVESDDERYRDGGFTGNPALFPLIYE